MKKILHYAGNISGAILALALDIILQVLYFEAVRVHEITHLPIQVQAIITAAITAIGLWFIFWLYKKQLEEVNHWGFNEIPHWDVKRIGKAIIGFILITVLGAITLSIVSQGQTSSNQQSLDRLAKNSGQLYKIMVIFIAPYIEEVVFRGMFFNTFFTKETKFNKWMGIITSGFLFAYIHDPGLTRFILVYWVLGMVLAWVYMSTKDLRYSMLTHMAYNALGFI